MTENGEPTPSRSFIRRHWILTAAVAVAIVVALPVAWYLGSPLFLNSRVNESFPTPVASQPGGSGTPALTPAQASGANPVAVASGSLRGIDHRSSGTATLYTLGDGQKIVRLDHDTQNGPDLYVYLIAAPDYSKKSDANDFIDLGELKGNQGQQNYSVPPGTDLSKYRTVMIWCKQFSVPFAAAPLSM